MASLTLGVLGICAYVVPFAGFILGLVAIGLGIIGESLIRKSDGALTGEGMVWAGLILGIVSVAIAGLIWWITGSMFGYLPRWVLLQP